MDKRDLSSLFRERLRILLQRFAGNQSAFAASIGMMQLAACVTDGSSKADAGTSAVPAMPGPDQYRP